MSAFLPATSDVLYIYLSCTQITLLFNGKNLRPLTITKYLMGLKDFWAKENLSIYRLICIIKLNIRS